jgi:small subunit ribosomal protein S17
MARIITGVVSSNKNDKTIVVRVQATKTHPLYRKKFMVSKKFMAHDEKNEAQEGDKVTIIETRPLSARKRFVLKAIVEKAPIRHTEPAPVVKEEKPAETKTVKAEEKAS